MAVARAARRNSRREELYTEVVDGPEEEGGVPSREHYPSDVLAGGAIAFVVAGAAWKLRPPATDGGTVPIG